MQSVSEIDAPKPLSYLSGGDNVEDLICIGFGPASLAIAIALQESAPSFRRKPKVSFLERQPKFAWHSGMQLPGARMQISFLKDLATPRNPQSQFTFINYLYQNNRLQHFTNIGTFTPSRAEYEDYLRWCANHFDAQGLVSYSQEVLDVSPEAVGKDGKVTQFRVTSRNAKTSKVTTRVARKVVIAVGGKAVLPQEFPAHNRQVVHSSMYSTQVHAALPDANKPYNIAVVGSGQSAAEIFNDLPSRYPNAKVTMIIRSAHLRPSDDSPFVNEIFDPDRVDGMYQQSASVRAKIIAADRATNYSVVRLNLLEHLYEKLYAQRRENPDPASWKVHIKPSSRVFGTQTGAGAEKNKIRLQIATNEGCEGSQVDEMDVDAVFVATGYVRNAHQGMLANTKSLLRDQSAETFPVTRSYKVDFDEAKVAEGAGVWLQGCNESTHGLSDTLLSIVAIRSGELVKTMFGEGEELNLRAKL